MHGVNLLIKFNAHNISTQWLLMQINVVFSHPQSQDSLDIGIDGHINLGVNYIVIFNLLTRMRSQDARLMAKMEEHRRGGRQESFVEGMLRTTHQKFFRRYAQDYLNWLQKQRSKEHMFIHSISEIHKQDRSNYEDSNSDIARYLLAESSFDQHDNQYNQNSVTRSQLRPEPARIFNSEVRDSKQTSEIKMTKKNEVPLHLPEPVQAKKINNPSATQNTNINRENNSLGVQKRKSQRQKVVVEEPAIPFQTASEEVRLKKDNGRPLKQEASEPAKPERKDEVDVVLGNDEEIYSGLESRISSDSGNPIKFQEKIQEEQEQIIEEEQAPSYYDLISMQSQITVNSQSSAGPKKDSSEEFKSNQNQSNPSSFEKPKEQNILQSSFKQSATIQQLQLSSESKRSSPKSQKQQVRQTEPKQLQALKVSGQKEQSSVMVPEYEQYIGQLLQTMAKEVQQQQITGKYHQTRQVHNDGIQSCRQVCSSQQEKIQQSKLQSHGLETSQEQPLKIEGQSIPESAPQPASIKQSPETREPKQTAQTVEGNQESELPVESQEEPVRQNQTFITAQEANQTNEFQSFLHQEDDLSVKESLCDPQENQIQANLDLEALLNQHQNEQIKKRVGNIVDKFFEQLEVETFCESCLQTKAQRQLIEKERSRLHEEVEEVKRENLRFKEINLNLMKKLEELDKRVRQLEDQNFIGSSKVNRNKLIRQRSQELVNESYSSEPNEKTESEVVEQSVRYNVDYESEKNSSDLQNSCEPSADQEQSKDLIPSSSIEYGSHSSSN